MAALEPLVPMLQIDVPESARRKGLVVLRNGVALNQAAWSTPLPTDPGVVEIAAQAPGYKPWKTSIEVKPGSKEQVAVAPLAIEDAPPPPPPGAVATRDRAADGWPTAKSLGLTAMIAGAVGVGVGALVGSLALDKKEESDAACPIRDDERRCTGAGADAMSSANTLAWGSNIAIGAGAILLVGGGVLFFATPSRSGPRATLTPGLGSARLDVRF